MLDIFNEYQGHCYYKNTTWETHIHCFFQTLSSKEKFLGPVLNNCSLNKLSIDSIGCNFGSVQIKSMEFVDDLADSNRDKQSALASNAVFEVIQHEKW